MQGKLTIKKDELIEKYTQMRKKIPKRLERVVERIEEIEKIILRLVTDYYSLKIKFNKKWLRDDNKDLKEQLFDIYRILHEF
jgi:hypothetical protein